MVPFADAVFAMDRNWWHRYGDRIAQGPELWTSNREAARLWHINHIQAEMGGGMSPLPGRIRLGGNSGFQALQLALYFGAARVVLLGYDMMLAPDGAAHWHTDYKGLGNPLKDRMPRWCAAFAEIPHSIRARVINASQTTSLRCFRRATLEDCLSLPEAQRS